MISEFGNYNSHLAGDDASDTAVLAQETVVTGDSDDTADEVTIGSLLFDSPSIYSSIPRRRFRVRSSTVI